MEKTRMECIENAVYDAVETYYGFTKKDLFSKVRLRMLTDAKMVAIHVARVFSGMGESQLANVFNFRNRSTVIWYHHRYDDLCYDSEIKDAVKFISDIVDQRLKAWQAQAL